MAIEQPCLRFDSDAARWTQLFGPARRWRRFALGLALLTGVAGFPNLAVPQQDNPSPIAPTPSSPPPQGPAGRSTMHGAEDQDPMVHRAEQRMSERRNEDRQKALQADTDRLLSLAQQLKSEVDKTNKDQLSVDVFKRAEQIEKLAHSVKEKMRGY